MFHVSIVGPGRVGGALALSLVKDKYVIDQLIGRQGTHFSLGKGSASPYKIASIDQIESITSDIVFVTTGDGAIEEASRILAGLVKPGSFAFHTSGALSSLVLHELRSAGCHVGSIHPLVSISRPEVGPSRFPDAFFCVEGEPEAVELAIDIVRDLRGRSFTVSTKYKTLYHAAAVMACGHLVALFDSAVEALTKCGLTPDRAKEVLLPLVFSTVENLGEQSTSSALTGTFARADIETFSRHLAALNENVSDDLLEIYLLLGERSLELASKEGVNAERIDNLRAKMSIAKSRLKW